MKSNAGILARVNRRQECLRYSPSDTSVNLVCARSAVVPCAIRFLRSFEAVTRCICVLFLSMAALHFSASPCLAAEEATTNAVVKAAFEGDCEKLLVEQIDRADKEILVAIYSMTRRSITGALVKAVGRGVKVRVKYDAVSHSDSEAMNDTIQYLERKGVKCIAITLSGEKDSKMHDKFTVIDRKRVLTGSFNYTTSASTRNYENLVLIESAEIAKQYIAEFENIKNK
jgi:phosphatidylserine/phosphatidylglycerophosphate/cardiolipin synthase-like enzyme